MKKRITLSTVLALLILGAVGAQAGVAVVAHPGVAGDAAELQKIFLGKASTWSDGTAAVPVTLADDAQTKAFLGAFVKKSPSQFKTFWKKAVFSGTGTPPQEFKTEAELVAFVAATPGAVGYVSDTAATDGVKVIATQ